MRAAIVIPALNEEATVARVVAAVAPFGSAVVVDDGSIDATGERAEAAGAVVVRHERNGGYDAALASGFQWASEHDYDAVVSIDADGQHDPTLLGRVLDPLAAAEVDMVLGIRAAPARVSERLFGMYTARRFGVPDVLCGVKAFRVATYRQHRAAMASSSIGTGLALACLRAGVRFGLVPVPIAPRADAPRVGSTLRANLLIGRALGRALVADGSHAANRAFRH